MARPARRLPGVRLRGLAIVAVLATLLGSACHARRRWAPAAGGVYLPGLIGSPEATLRTAVTRQLGLAPDADLAAQGLDIYVRHGLVDTVFIHVLPERAGGPAYHGPLFGGLAPTMRRPDVEALLGSPDTTSKPGAAPMFPAVSGSWIKYDRADSQVNVEFTGDGGPIRLITLMRPDWQPGDE